MRSDPFSSHFPEYNQDALKSALARYRISYLFLGREYGARQTAREYYTDGHLDFEKYRNSKSFFAGCDRVISEMERGKTVLFLCAEKEPVNCHRAIMIAPWYCERNYDLVHLLPKGRKSQKEVENKLLCLHFPSEFTMRGEQIFNSVSMFRNGLLPGLGQVPSIASRLAQAYRMQNAKIGFSFTK